MSNPIDEKIAELEKFINELLKSVGVEGYQRKMTYCMAQLAILRELKPEWDKMEERLKATQNCLDKTTGIYQKVTTERDATDKLLMRWNKLFRCDLEDECSCGECHRPVCNGNRNLCIETRKHFAAKERTRRG